MPLPLPPSVAITTIDSAHGQSLGFAADELGEFDDVADLIHIENTVRTLGISVERAGWGGTLLQRLVENPPHLLWNLNSGIAGTSRTSQVPSVCELLGVPLVGSGAWTASVVQDKLLTLLVCERLLPHLAYPRGVVITRLEEFATVWDVRQGGACVIKPNNDESSRGLRKVEQGLTWAQTVEVAREIFAAWGPVRIEEYVPGIDVSANAAVDASGSLVPLAPTILLHGEEIYSGPAKARMTHRRIALAELSEELDGTVRTWVQRLCGVLKFRHYARFDFRVCVEAKRAVFLEANLCPSFEPNDDFAFSAQLDGIDYAKLMGNILGAAERDRQEDVWFRDLPGRVRNKWDADQLRKLVRKQ